MPASISYVILDVFTSEAGHGNPLAVCRLPPDSTLSQDQLQNIAKDFNLSETVFLHELQLANVNDESSHIPSYRVQIFTVEQEISFAGHPTIGVSQYIFSTFLKQAGFDTEKVRSIKLHCPAGVIDVRNALDLMVEADIPHNFHKHVEHDVTMETQLKLQPALTAAAIRRVDLVSPVRGMTFLTVELASLDDLSKVAVTGVRPDSLIVRDKGWEEGFLGTAYYVHDPEDSDRYRTRMIEGSIEDPATGSMSCALATLLAMESGSRHRHFVFKQAVEMGRPSHIQVSVHLDASLAKCEKITLSGQAVQVKEGVLNV